MTVTLSPDTGYELDEWNITGGITPTATATPNVYTFTMPANAVTVSATFKSTGGGGGTNLVVNGDFSDGTNGWTSTATSFTVSDGTAHVIAAKEDGKGIRQTITGLTVGNTYRISFDVISGKAKFIRDEETGIDVSAGTTYTTTFVASGNSTTLVFGGYEYQFTLDNVSLVDTSGGGGGGGGGEDPTGNLLDMTASAWSGSPSISGDTMTLSSSANVTVAQSFTTIPGHTYTVTGAVNNRSNGNLTFTVSGGGTGSQSIARWLSDHEALSIEFTATGTTTTLTITKSEKDAASIDNLQVLAVPSGDASPFEDTGPGDDGPVLDLDGARGNMLGDGEGGILVGTYTITASNSWELLLENLVSTELINGEEVFYVYYVEEVAPAGVGFSLVGYQNNGGITAGDITIINTASEEEREHIVLPETGGGGNWPYVVGGATLMTVCLFGGVVMTRRRRKASG